MPHRNIAQPNKTLSWIGEMIANVMLKKVVSKKCVLWILLALLPCLPKAAVTFGRRPETTCGVLGGEAHLVWEYNDDGDTVNVIYWYNGTEAGPGMGTYFTGSGDFTAFSSYQKKINFTASDDGAGSKVARLTFYGLEAADGGLYTTIFQASTSTNDEATLEIAEVADFLGWDICVDDTCNAISDPLTLSASADVKVKFTKGGALTSDMDIDVAPSVGGSFDLVVPAGPGATAEHALADAATLLDAGSLSIDLAFEKNGVVFHTDTIAAVSVIPDNTTRSPDTPGGPNTWNDLYVIPIVLGVCILVIIIVVVVVVRRRKKMETGRPHPQDRSSGVGASAAGMPPGGQPMPKSQPNPQSGAPSGDMAYKVGYVDPDAPALYHDDRYESGFGNTGYSH